MHTLTSLFGAEGLLDLGTEKINGLTTLLRGLSVLMGIGFLIFRGFQTKGAMAAIVVAGLAAGLFIWLVFNVTNIKDRVDAELNAAPAPAGVTVHAVNPDRGDLW